MEPKKKRALSTQIFIALVLAIIAGVIFGNRGQTAYAISGASYPSQPQRVSMEEYQEGMAAFLTATVPEFLSGHAEENAVYSPLNVYLALSMLCELTEGNTRAQILTLLGSDSAEEQRERAKLLWQVHYRDEKEGKCILANSVWLDDRVAYNGDTMRTLAEDYYASSYSGPMKKLVGALQDWLNDQTGGLLKKQAGSLTLPEDTLLALASTVYFRGKWASEFRKENTSPQTFRAPTGEQTADFMHEDLKGYYYWGEKFGAVNQGFSNGCAMWYFLPDEGVTPEDLLQDAECMSLLTADYEKRGEWEQNKHLI